MTKSGIYIIQNTESGKVYIGSAINLKKRKIDHYNSLKRNEHFNKHFQNAFNKYGEEAFEWKIIVKCSKEDLIHKEQKAIDKYRENLGWSMLYNNAPKAGSCLGVKHSPEACAKLSARMMGMKHSPERVAKMSAAQKRPEVRAKKSVAMKGKPWTTARWKAQEERKKGDDNNFLVA